jgi:formyltetrahydrofolate synthetase
MLKKDINKILRNKDGSYVVKEMYRLFDKSVLEPLTEAYMAEFDKNISDKFAICIFKEITVLASSDEAKLKDLLKKFFSHFQEMKTSTFYHFGIQYFIEVRNSFYSSVFTSLVIRARI